MPEYSRRIDVWGYDLETDTLFFHDNKIKYKSSIDLGDLILDIGEDGSPIGVELLNASKNFDVSKVVLKKIQTMNSDIKVSYESIEVKVRVCVTRRNALIEKVSVSRGINDVNLQVGQTAMVC